MESVILVTAFSLSVALTILLTPLLSALALRRGWVDVPDTHRKMHSRPIPPVGGVTIFVGFIGGLAYLTLFADQLSFELPKLPLLLILSLLAMVLTGLYDDIRGLGFKGKFLMQIIVAYVLLHAGYRVDVSHLPFIGDDPYVQALISIPLTLLWIVGTINAVNLIDGLDGLAGGVVLIAFACLAAVFGLHGDVGLAVMALVVVGALVGFLAYNFSPASVFMGDAGSLFLGCLLAAYSLSGETHSDPFLALLIPVVALGFPLLDTGLSIIRRLARGSAIFAPDSDHIHHRLARRWPHWQAVLVLYAAAGLFGVSAIAMSMFAPMVGFAVFAITAGGCGAGLLLLGYIRLREASESSEKEAVLEQSEPALEQVIATTGDGARDSADSRLIWNVVNARGDEEVKDILARALAAESRTSTRVSGQVIKPEERNDRNRMRSLVRGKGEEIKSAIEMLSKSSVVVAAEGLSVADLDGEAVVLDSLKGRYFGLNEVGARILSLMQEPRPVDELVELVGQEYDISRDSLERDVLAFLSKLESKSLVQVSDSAR